MDVDYAPNGWAAYQIGSGKYPSMGGTGMPVGIRMSLDFKETSIVTKASRQFASLGKNRNTEGNRINFAAENPQLTPGTYFTSPPAAVAAADAADNAKQAFIDLNNETRK
jgi:hypothetical protein